MHIEINRCPKCGGNEWVDVDTLTTYIHGCNNGNCLYEIRYNKQDYIDNFTCPDCNCFSGTLEENNKFIAVRCQNCGKQQIVLEKHTDFDVRDVQRKRQAKASVPVRCPKCGSASISTGARGVNFKWGLIGASKTVNRCANCGHMWKP